MTTAQHATVLQVNNLNMQFIDENGVLEAIQDMTFSVRAQEFLCVIGPSGSGKSVLLRILGDLLQPTRGEVKFFALNGNRKPRFGFVFQDANLMPWRTVLQNISLPLELQGVALDEAYSKAREWIDIIDLQGFENTWPRDLSGGMAQRVAIARALIHDPDFLLLDEPFGALDALTRERMGTELLHLWQARRKTVIMVTHSISEALLLSDRVLVFSPRPGKVYLDLNVELPRPRVEDVRYSDQFGQLARRIRNAIQ